MAISLIPVVEYFEVKISLCEMVYQPAEDTLLLARFINPTPGEVVLDMGTGTGLLGLIAAKKAARVVGLDINSKAVGCARLNARLNGIENFEARRSDLFEKVSESFDTVLFNPPYLPTEPLEPVDCYSRAWDGGVRGRAVVERFLGGVKEHLNPGGWIFILGSSLSGYEDTMSFLISEGFDVSVVGRQKLDFEELVVISAVHLF